MRISTALVAIALATGTGLIARKPGPLTRTSVLTMAPDVLNRRLFGELSGIMFRIPRFGRAFDRPDQPLQWLHFLTQPYTTEDGGVCGTMHLTVYFQPMGASRGAQTPVRPWRVLSEENFFLLDDARLRSAEPIGDLERPRLERACASQDPRARHWFTAPSSSEVAEAARLVGQLVEAARRGRSTGPLDCTPLSAFGHAPVDESACIQIIARLDPTRILGVGACALGQLCLRVIVDDGNAISFERQLGNPAPLRISVEPNIVVTG